MGTAAGAAKARARATERAKAKQAVRELIPAPDAGLMRPDPALMNPDAPDRSVEIPTPVENPTLTEQALALGEPHAAGFVLQVVSGTAKVPASVRLDASFRLLEGRAKLGNKPAAGGLDLEAAAGAVLARLEGAMRSRDRRQGAEDAKILPSGRVIEAEKPDKTGS